MRRLVLAFTARICNTYQTSCAGSMSFRIHVHLFNGDLCLVYNIISLQLLVFLVYMNSWGSELTTLYPLLIYNPQNAIYNKRGLLMSSEEMY